MCHHLASSVLGDIQLLRSTAVKDILNIVAAAKAVLGMKLHLGIAAVAQGTSFVQAAYRTKCYDFAETIGAGDALVRTDDPELGAKLKDRLAAVLDGERCWDEAKVQALRSKFLQLGDYLS